MRIFSTASAAFAVTQVFLSNALAQNYDAMMQQMLQQNQMLTQQMQQAETSIVNQNMNDPRVQQAYQQYIHQGGQMPFQQFAYGYAATGGYSADGIARYNQSERQIQQNDYNSVQAYRQNQANNYQWMQGMHERNSEIARYRGNLMNGTSDYTDPRTGQQYNLPNTQAPNTMMYDQNTGQQFYYDPRGNYYRGDPDGWMRNLDENQ